MIAKAKNLEVFSKEGSHFPTVQIDPRFFAAGVMAAGKPRDIAFDSVSNCFRDDVAAEVDGKSQIVPSGDETHRTLSHF